MADSDTAVDAPPSPLSDGNLTVENAAEPRSPPGSPQPMRRVNPRTGERSEDYTLLYDAARRARFSDVEQFLGSQPFDIDSRHYDEPQFAGPVAEKVYGFLHETEKERLRGDGVEVLPTSRFGTRESYCDERQRFISWLFERNMRYMETRPGADPLVSTDAVHLAVYYLDRFVESHEGRVKNLISVMFAAVHLASKYVDIYPVALRKLRYLLCEKERKSFTEKDVFKLEGNFLVLLKDFMGPTTTAFAHRYLQTVGMEENRAAVHTARYLCTLGICRYDLTGEYYSKIAAAAVFIAYNKYAAATSTGDDMITHPRTLEHHCGYTMDEIEPVVVELVNCAKEVERAAQARRGSDAKRFPLGVYFYYKKAGIVTTKTFPEFEQFFHNHRTLGHHLVPGRPNHRRPAAAATATDAGPSQS